MELVLYRGKFFAEIPRPKKPRTLPKHLSQQDAKRLLDHTPNLKHNAMVCPCYGIGPRVSEPVSLMVTKAHLSQIKSPLDNL